jgi:hypothetical protein
MTGVRVDTGQPIDDHGSRYRGSNTTEQPNSPWHITTHWAEVDGVLECVGLDIRAFGGFDHNEDGQHVARPVNWGAKVEPVTATLLRTLSVAELIRRQLSIMHDLVSWKRDELNREDIDPAVFKRDEKRRRRWTSRDLSAVAAIYGGALDQHNPPRQAVAEAFDVSPSMASKLIRQTRDAGLLGEPTSQGKAGNVQREGGR